MINASSLIKVSEKKSKEKKDPVGNKNDIIVSLEDVKNYLQENKHLLLQDKNKFTAETLMMLLDNDKLAALEDEFNEHPNGIELSNFVWLMKCAIVHSQEEKYELINGLIKLFQDIDINGDHHMEWSEFTQYIIDAVIGEKDAKFFDARFERERELTENEIFDRAYSKKTKRYFPCKYFDNTTHQSHIKKAVYSPHIDAILCLEQNSSKLKFYTHDCREVEVQQKKFFLQPPAEEKQQPFILDFTIAESLNTIVVTTSDRQFFFWENNMNNRSTKNFKTDVLQTGIWYLPIHKLWISGGADYNIRTWKFNDFEDQSKITHDKLMLAHLKLITAIEELISPRLIASGSLDGKIKLWDLTDPSNPPILITELRDPNQNPRGILGLSYSCQYGSNLLSYGFENHINIWCPEVSITRAFIGKLEGHSSLVQICKFMDMSPNVISIDDKCNCRIWDIRGMNTIQVINSDGQFSVIYDVAILSQKHDMFVLAGKRLAYYENVVYKEQAKNTSEDVYPISIDFNTYYNQFCVLTKNDMRIYDAMTGKLKKVFNDLTDEKFPVDLSTFCLGARQRKFFVADNIGLIRQYNMKNGEFLKSCNSLNETESSEFTKKQSNIKKKENNQISQMLYLTEEKLLIAAYYDSTIRIYDEEESEETVLLKVMTGAHKDSEITSLVYSEKFSLFATGSTNGRIAIWEFESGKLENILIAREKGEITCLQFGDPYPVLLSAGAAGVINVWGIKGCPPQYKYKNIGRYVNSYWETESQYHKVPITYLICETSIQPGVPRQFVQDKFAPIQRGSFDPVMKEEKKDDAGTKRKKDIFNFQINTNLNSTSNAPLTQTNNTNTLTFPTETGYGAPLSPNPRDGDDGNEQGYQQSQINQNQKFQETIYDYQLYFDSYHKQMDEKKRRFYVIIGDQKGMVHVLNLTDIFQKRNIQPMKDEKKRKFFSLRRKDFINAQKSVDTYLSAPDRRGEKLPSYVHTYNSILINRWEVHTGPINYMLRIPDPLCFASCSSDKTIKIWSLSAAMWGKIHLMKFGKNEWSFPYDWVENKLKDMEEVFEQISALDNENLTNKEKEKVKMKYLSTQFFKETTQEDIKNKKYDALYPPKQLTDEEIFQIEKAELYTYRLKPKPYVDPIQQLRQQIQEEDEKARIYKKKNEPFLKVKPIEEDLTPIKIFYKILPNDKPHSQYQSVQLFKSQLDAIESGLTAASQELKIDPQQSRKPSNMASEQRDSYSNLPRSQYKNRSSSRFINKSQKINQSNINNNNNNTASQSQIKQKSIAQDQKISAFISKQKSSILKQQGNNSLPSASLTSLVKPTTQQKKGHDIYKKFNFRQIRPQTSSINFNHVRDVKYTMGEGSRVVRIATDQYTYQQASLAPLKFFKDMDLVQEKNKFYVDLAQNYDGRLKKDLTKLNVGGDNEINYDSDDSEKKPKKKTGSVKIVATSTFLNNPNRNKHKVLKTGEKIYVIEQDG